MNHAILKYVPMNTTRNNYRKPWMDREVMKSVRKKRELWDRYTASRDLGDYQLYQSQNNASKVIMRRKRRSYEEGLLTQSNKRFFGYIQRTLNSSVQKITLKHPITLEVVTDSKKISDILPRVSVEYIPERTF